MTYEEFLDSDLTLEDYVAATVAEKLAQFDAEIAAEHAREQEQAAMFRDAMRMVAVACGVRTRQVDYFADSTKAADLFELRDGKITAKPGVANPSDPCASYDVTAWMADLRERDLANAHPHGGIWWEGEAK